MTNNSMLITRVVETELARRSSARNRDMAMRRKEVQNRCPEVAELEKQLNSTALDFSYKIMQSPSDAKALKALADDIVKSKKREINSLLLSSGFPEDYLESKPFCRECGDTGYVKGRLCSCMRQAVINARFSNCGVNPNESFSAFRFDILSDPKDRRVMRRIYDYCLAYADAFPNNDMRDLLFIGSPGVGKTYLLNCIGGRVLSRGYSVLKINAHRLIQTVMDSMREEPSERPDFNMPQLLIIDDLGTEPMINNVSIESLLSIICERQDENKATVIATNHSTDELAQRYGTRIASRLIAPRTVKVIPIETENVRLKNN